MPPLTTIAEATPNRNYPVPVSSNSLAFDLNRLRMAFSAIDGDVASLFLAIASAASLDNPHFTGEPEAPTAVPGTNTNVLATTAFVMAALASFDLSDIAPVDSPQFTGNPTAPTADVGDNSTRVANTAFVKSLFAQLIGAAPEALNTIYEIASALQNNPDILTSILTTLGLKANQSDLLEKLAILQPFADVASSATTNLGGVASQNVRITGTTTITSFGTSPSGTIRRIRFTGGLILTHNAGSLILPGAANIATSSNDSLLAVSLGGGNWIVLEYHFASRASERAALNLGALATAGFGDIHGQFTNMTGSRANNTAYLNNTGKWLVVSVTHTANGAFLDISLDGVAWGTMVSGGQLTAEWMMVPPGWYYRATFNGSLTFWQESRG